MKKKVQYILFFQLLAISMVPGQITPANAAVPEPVISFAPRHYVCYRCAGPVRIDGHLNEPSWQKAVWTEIFVDIEGSTKPIPPLRTRAKMLWDDRSLYIAAELEEPEVWATLKQRDSVIFNDNDFEVFIDPDGDTHQYYELELNAFGTAWDLLLVKPYRDGGPAVVAWDIRGLSVGAVVDGTLNDPVRKDRGWTVEISLPWETLKECAPGGRPPSAGEQWRINFSRVEWNTRTEKGKYQKVLDPVTGRPLPENNWVWSPQGLINMHYPEMWGFLQFSAQIAGVGTEAFVPNPEEPVKWALRQVYYRERNYFAKTGCYSNDPQELGLANQPPGLSIEVVGPHFFASCLAASGSKRWYTREDGVVWRQ